jgi:hypothetical protein
LQSQQFKASDLLLDAVTKYTVKLKQYAQTPQVSAKIIPSLRSLNRKANRIFHYHIFKNAGSSVDHILRENFGERWTPFEGATPTSVMPHRAVNDLLQRKPEIAAVSSHLLRPPPCPEKTQIPLVFLRDPLDRAYSVYSQERRLDTNVLSSVIAMRSSFVEYVDWCLNNLSKGGMVIANYQVIHLSPASFRWPSIYDARATERDLAAAINLLSGFPVAGLVEEFVESMERFREACLERGIELRTFPVRANRSSERSGSLHERRLELMDMMPRKLLRAFREANALDERLYQWGRRRFWREGFRCK